MLSIKSHLADASAKIQRVLDSLLSPGTHPLNWETIKDSFVIQGTDIPGVYLFLERRGVKAYKTVLSAQKALRNHFSDSVTLHLELSSDPECDEREFLMILVEPNQRSDNFYDEVDKVEYLWLPTVPFNCRRLVEFDEYVFDE